MQNFHGLLICFLVFRLKIYCYIRCLDYFVHIDKLFKPRNAKRHIFRRIPSIMKGIQRHLRCWLAHGLSCHAADHLAGMHNWLYEPELDFADHPVEFLGRELFEENDLLGREHIRKMDVKELSCVFLSLSLDLAPLPLLRHYHHFLLKLFELLKNVHRRWLILHLFILFHLRLCVFNNPLNVHRKVVLGLLILNYLAAKVGTTLS